MNYSLLQAISKTHLTPNYGVASLFITDEQNQLAQKFAHGIFCLRPFPLQSIAVGYEKSKAATMKVNYNFKDMAQWSESTDFKNFGDWIVKSQDEDFLDPNILREVVGD